jgi:hypothetical protein
MHRAQATVPSRAKGLEDGSVEDVRPHCERRLEAEEQDQERRQ